MRQSNIQPEGVTTSRVVVESRQRRPLWQRLGACAVGTALVLAAYGKIANIVDVVPKLPNLVPQVEREVRPGISQVIALELQKTREFRGTDKKYAVITELTKRETINYHVFSKTKESEAYISTLGTAKGVIDFSGVTEADITVSEDNKLVKIRLPHAEPADVVVSHRPEDIHITTGENGWCQASLNCDPVTQIELLQQADKIHADAVGKDKELLTAAEQEAQGFLDFIINGVAMPLLRNQNPAGPEPSRLTIQLEFGAPVAGPTVPPAAMG